MTNQIYAKKCFIVEIFSKHISIVCSQISFSNNRNTVILNVYDYQQAAYKEAGFGKHIPLGQEFKCLYKANENLLVDIIDTLQKGKSVVVEQTLYKAKRRIAYIDAIRNAVESVDIEVYFI